MPCELTISPPRDERDIEALSAITSHTFQAPLERMQPYYEAAGKQNLRIAIADGQVAGGLVLLPMGQFWGGGEAARAIPMTGIGSVAVAPEHRSGGVGLRLMQSVVRELYDAGVPLSSLYPATQPVYRRAGYEFAGHSCETVVWPAGIEFKEPSINIRPMTPEDQATVRALYKGWAEGQPGNLERNEFIWGRLADLRGMKRRGYVMTGARGIEGYFYYGHRPNQMPHVLDVGDCVLTTPASARRFLQFLADHRSMTEKVCWVGPPLDPLLMMLREQSCEVTAKTRWMLRIVRPEEALAMRSYPVGMTAELGLELTDELLPQNCGKYVLRVEKGRGEVRRGAEGNALAITLSLSGLAPLYSALFSAEQLAILGMVGGSREALAVASAMFAAPVPWMRDGF